MKGTPESAGSIPENQPDIFNASRPQYPRPKTSQMASNGLVFHESAAVAIGLNQMANAVGGQQQASVYVCYYGDSKIKHSLLAD